MEAVKQKVFKIRYALDEFMFHYFIEIQIKKLWPVVFEKSSSLSNNIRARSPAPFLFHLLDTSYAKLRTFVFSQLTFH